MNGYQKLIAETLKCDAKTAKLVEDCMREYVFSGYLDHLTAAEFKKGARKALKILKEMEQV